MKSITLSLMLALMVLSGNALAAGQHDKHQFMQYLQHANPVPNYVSVIRKNSETLGISESQMQQVMAWNKSHSAAMRERVMAVIDGEKKMREASMQGAPAGEILALAHQVSNTRMQIITGKTQCRDHMMSILSAEQWQQLTALMAQG